MKPVYRYLILFAVIAGSLSISGYVYIDYHDSFVPAARALLRGEDPYAPRYGIYGPPWSLFVYVPLALLPDGLGASLFAALNVVTLAVLSRRLGASWAGVFLLLISPASILSLNNGNLEALTLLGMALPPPLGVFFLAMKPQLTVGLLLYFLIRRNPIKTYAPLAAGLGLSLLAFGMWPQRAAHMANSTTTLWPWLLPVGLGLLVYAVRSRRADLALAASPCLAPYGTLAVWLAPLLVLSRRTWEMAAVIAGMWTMVALLAHT